MNNHFYLDRNELQRCRQAANEYASRYLKDFCNIFIYRLDTVFAWIFRFLLIIQTRIRLEPDSGLYRIYVAYSVKKSKIRFESSSSLIKNINWKIQAKNCSIFVKSNTDYECG